tara:strand:- start:10015 stop:10506 length:492 start_codon:yes stop_codon:yes gene_type:complete
MTNETNPSIEPLWPDRTEQEQEQIRDNPIPTEWGEDPMNIYIDRFYIQSRQNWVTFTQDWLMVTRSLKELRDERARIQKEADRVVNEFIRDGLEGKNEKERQAHLALNLEKDSEYPLIQERLQEAAAEISYQEGEMRWLEKSEYLIKSDMNWCRAKLEGRHHG